MLENRKIFTLHAILNRVQQVFDELMLGKYFWVKVEVLKVSKDRRGHYYLELVEQVDDQVLARCRATIWQRNVERCIIDGGEELEKVVKAGAEILCYGEAVFHPMYGFSLHVIHVDYAFSLGEIERKKQMTLMQLSERGLLQLNKSKACPIVLQKIAVVASVGTSGYEDFVQHLTKNPYAFNFVLTPFDTQVQGEEASANIIRQLAAAARGNFDVVVIIRGGGSKFDLDVFNSLQVAAQIAQMPFAVFTGIGHETDSTVADFVSHTYFKTPSAVAAYIVALALAFDVYLTQSRAKLMEQTHRLMEQTKNRLIQLEEGIGNNSKFRIGESQGHLETQTTALSHVVQQLIQQSTSELRLVELTLESEAKILLKKKENTVQDYATRLAFWGKQSIGGERQRIIRLHEMIIACVKYKVTHTKAKLEQREEILPLFTIEHLLRKGFAVVRHQGKVLNEFTVLHKGDELELEIHNKVYQITIDSIEEIKRWKNLLMNEQLMN